MKTFYESMREILRDEHLLVSLMGENTVYEAIIIVRMNEETCQWSGMLLFKDERFSPNEVDDLPLGLQYRTPTAGNGTLAVIRAENFYTQLVGIFTRLMAHP